MGDALGSPYEGLSGETIFRNFGAISPIIAHPGPEPITYTDDTQMTIGVAECLLEAGRIESDRLAECFRRNYESDRGYGAGMRRILDTMSAGGDWKPLLTSLFPGGSFGNGAAMRVAPVGLLFSHDPQRVREEAALSAAATHLHPLGIDGAVIVAAAIAYVLREPEFEAKAFYAELTASAQTEEFKWQLRTAGRLSAEMMVSFGSTLAAHRSVTTAITCFTVWPNSYENVIAKAIGIGEDTDTLAAIAGAISGAHLGIHAIPPALLAKLENGPKGRDYIDSLAIALYDKWLAGGA